METDFTDWGLEDRHIDASATVCVGQSLLHSLIISNESSDTAGTVYVYDGNGITANKKLELSIPAKETLPIRFTPMLPMRQGIYIVMTTVTGCFVRWRALKE